MTSPTGNRCYDPRGQARAIRKQRPGPVGRPSRCTHGDHWHLGRLGRAAKLAITIKESA